MRKNSKAFTMPEILIALIFLSLASVAYFSLNRANTRTSMNAYYEMMAFSLAREPIEVYRTLGYDVLAELAEREEIGIAEYPIGKDMRTAVKCKLGDQMQYPIDAENFEREILLEHDKGKKDERVPFVKITVNIYPVENKKISKFIVKPLLELSGIVARNIR